MSNKDVEREKRAQAFREWKKNLDLQAELHVLITEHKDLEEFLKNLDTEKTDVQPKRG